MCSVRLYGSVQLYVACTLARRTSDKDTMGNKCKTYLYYMTHPKSTIIPVLWYKCPGNFIRFQSHFQEGHGIFLTQEINTGIHDNVSPENMSLKVCDQSRLKLAYCKVPKFLDTRKLCCNLPKIQTKRQNLRGFCQKDANGKANSEDPDQTAPRGAV